MSSCTISRLQIADFGDHSVLEQLNGLVRQLSPDSTFVFTEEGARRLLQDSSTAIFVARSSDGAIIGMATLAPAQSFLAGRVGHVEDVVCDQAWRGQGVGRALMNGVIGHARSEGMSALQLTSRPSRVAANALYLKLGFEPRETNCYKMAF